MKTICLGLACTFKSKRHWQPIKLAVNDLGRMKEQGSCPLHRQKKAKYFRVEILHGYQFPAPCSLPAHTCFQVCFQSYA